MQKTTKFVALLLTVVCLFSGCGNAAAEPTQTEATQPTAPLLAEVATQEELIAALAESPRVVLTSDIQLTQTVGGTNRWTTPCFTALRVLARPHWPVSLPTKWA